MTELLQEAKARLHRVKDYHTRLAVKKVIELCEHQQGRIESLEERLSEIDTRTAGMRMIR